MKPVDPLLLQRLTDRELSIEQIKQVIKEAETNPQQWSTIAKALIEEQVWQNQILSASQSDSPASLPNSPASFPNSPACQSDASASSSNFIVRPLDSNPGQRSWPKWLSVLAGLMLAAVTGYWASGMVDSGSNGPSAFHSTELANSNSATSITPATFTPDYHLKFSDDSLLAGRGFSSDGQVPLYSIDNADDLQQFQQQQAFEPVSRELLQKLMSAGYRINNNIELISGDFDDQQKFVVPVRTIQLEPSQ